MTTDLLVELDPSIHQYIHVATGRRVRSVSEILRKSHVREAPFISGGGGGGSGGRRGLAMANALQRGRDVHRLTREIDEAGSMDEAFDDVFDPANVSFENLNFIAGYQRFLDISGYRPLAWETIVYHPTLDYAGRVDAVGWLGTKRIMIDRKTDKTLHRAVFLQLCAYRLAWDVCHPNEKIDQTFALILRDDMSFELKANPIEPGDEPFWLAAIWMSQWHDLVL